MATVRKFISNDFHYGMCDEQFGYKTDTSIFMYSASLIQNCKIAKAGGLELRPGTRKLTTALGANRIFSFIYSTDDRFLIVLRDKKLDIYRLSTEYPQTIELLSGDGFTTKLSADYIQEAQVAQDGQKFIVCHETMPPLVIECFDDDGEISFSVHDIVLDQTTDRYEEDEDTGEKTPYLYDYEGLFTTNNYPSAVAFCSNRLWFASSKENPYRIWVSQPFKYNNFQDFEYYSIIDEEVTTEEYLKAISEYTDSSIDNGDGTETRVTKTVSVEGYYIITKGTYDKETGELIGELETETHWYTKPSMLWEEITTEESAMILDLASDRNEKICWIAYALDSIVLGTTSSEWVIPYNANAKTASVGKISTYGSKKGAPITYGARNMFYIQSGGKRIRSLMSTSDGTAYLDMTYQCSSIITSKSMELQWQRVQDQALFVVLEDGDLAVLFYDSDYSLNAWVKWTFGDYKIKSLCIVDGPDGQDVVVLTQDGVIGILDDSLYYDFDSENEVEAILKTNPLDTSDTLTLNKKIYTAYVAAFKTKFSVEQEGVGAVTVTDSEYQQRFVKIHINTRPTNQDCVIVVRNIPGNPFKLAAVIVDMEVGE